ncbi:hypothetical protein EE612_054349, partial [Oryza sativa]
PYPFTLSPSTHPLHSSSPDRLSSSRSPPLATVSDGGRARWAWRRRAVCGSGRQWLTAWRAARRPAWRRQAEGRAATCGGEEVYRRQPCGRSGGRRWVAAGRAEGGRR